MTRYFFDFRSDGISSVDEDGVELSDMEGAHGQAVRALAETINDAGLEGATAQRFMVEVRDDIGPVLVVEGHISGRPISSYGYRLLALS